MKNKDWYKTKIDSIARGNGGNPPGETQFYKTTESKLSDWRNKPWNEWNNWGDVLEEFGYQRGKFNEPTDKAHILRLLAELTQSLNPPRVPLQVDMRRAKRQNPEFPNAGAILNRLGKKEEVVRALSEYCKDKPEYSRAMHVYTSFESTEQEPKLGESADEDRNKKGYVYLIKGRDGYHVGMTTAPYDRVSTIIKSLPNGGELIHFFATDDRRGIEKYWQNRWKSKQMERQNATPGEWFDLNMTDVEAFKRRKKFM